jgi:hypothetical protein
MARRRDASWWSVRVELIGGAPCGDLWPRPGRLFAVSPRHTFHTFAEAIDDAFARWDRSHLHEFTIAGGKTVTELRYLDDYDPARELDADVMTLGQLLKPGDDFEYTFDLGDNWRHQCMIAADLIDPADVVSAGITAPCPFWGWGNIPDPYGRLFDGDDGESPVPPPPAQWPWSTDDEPTITTVCLPGYYTRTTRLVEPDNDGEDAADGR